MQTGSAHTPAPHPDAGHKRRPNLFFLFISTPPTVHLRTTHKGHSQGQVPRTTSLSSPHIHQPRQASLWQDSWVGLHPTQTNHHHHHLFIYFFCQTQMSKYIASIHLLSKCYSIDRYVKYLESETWWLRHRHGDWGMGHGDCQVAHRDWAETWCAGSRPAWYMASMNPLDSSQGTKKGHFWPPLDVSCLLYLSLRTQ